jgi:hypothetical protein
MKFSAALTYDNISGFGKLTSKKFNAQSFAVRFAAIGRTAFTLFMCHVFLF